MTFITFFCHMNEPFEESSHFFNQNLTSWTDPSCYFKITFVSHVNESFWLTFPCLFRVINCHVNSFSHSWHVNRSIEKFSCLRILWYYFTIVHINDIEGSLASNCGGVHAPIGDYTSYCKNLLSILVYTFKDDEHFINDQSKIHVIFAIQ